MPLVSGVCRTASAPMLSHGGSRLNASKPEANPKTSWLYTIATNQAIDAQRRNRRHRMVSLDHRTGGEDEVGSIVEMLAGAGRTADEQMEDDEARDWVRAAVAELPEPLRGALMLVYHQGMKYREAADVLGIPVGTVKSRLHAALLRLNESWQRSGRSAAGSAE